MSEWGNPQQGELSEWQKAYVAGLLDGEGCITIVKDYSKNRCWLRVYIAQCARQNQTLFEVQKMFGGNVYIADRKNGEHWRWYLTDTKAHNFLLQIRDYLYIKKFQTEIAITFQNVKTNIRNFWGRHSYPDKVLTFFDRCRKLVSNANREGISPAAETERKELIILASKLKDKYATVHSTSIAKV